MRGVFLIVLVVGLALCGCAASPVVNLRTLADAGHAFPPPDAANVQVEIWRWNDDGITGTVAMRNQLTLEERSFLAGVEAGLRQSGFAIAGADDATAGYTMLATMETVSGMYDSYRRVPVMDTSWGWVHTRHGLEPYSATTSSDVIVPERRPYVHRIVTLTAIPSERVQDASALSPESPLVVWRGRIASDADVIDEALPAHVANMLADWGTTATRNVKYKRGE